MPLLTMGLAAADAGSLGAYRGLQLVVGVLLLGPALHTLWSVGRYFGVGRALGGDNFRQHCRDMPMVAEGSMLAMFAMLLTFCAFRAPSSYFRARAATMRC